MRVRITMPGHGARRRAEPVRAELVGQPRQRAQRQERDHDPERLADVAERRQDDAQQRRQRVRGGGDGDVEVRPAQMRHVAAPQQAVGGVVVEEAGADERPRDERSERDQDRRAQRRGGRPRH